MNQTSKSALYAGALTQAMGGAVALDGGSKNGYTHKQHIGWHGAGFALYAWIVDGRLCMVGEQVTGGDGSRPNGSLQAMNLGFVAACELASKVPGLASYFSEFPAGYSLPATAGAAGLSRSLSYPSFVAPNNAAYVAPAGGGDTGGNGGGSGSGSGSGGNTGGSGGGSGSGSSFFSTYKTPLIISGSVLALALIGLVLYFTLKK